LNFSENRFLQEKGPAPLQIYGYAKFFCWLANGAEMGAGKSVEI